MISRSVRRSPRCHLRGWVELAVAMSAILASASCSTRNPLGGEMIPIVFPPTPARVNNDIDILFMIDNSSSMTSMQQKLLAQLPTFMQVLQTLPMGFPSVHVAVVSSDMGAPSDQGQAGIGCSQTGGDNGQFTVIARGTCSATTLNPNADGSPAEFIMDDGAGTTKNFTLADPAGISTVFQCISLLGSAGCGFEHQLASIDRALGSDGQGPTPSTNQGFLRADAYLAIVMLTNEDDCSASPSSTPLPIYSLNGATENDIETPDGPIANYRCNGGKLGGHLCQDLNPGSASAAYAQPPLDPPPDATGTAAAPTLTLSNCESNDSPSSGLTPVSEFVADIKALKPDPDRQIVVAAVAGPTTPYTVEWLPGAASASDQLWPQLAHSCNSANGDGSFADPPVRIAQFVQAFGENGLLTSICDDDYAAAITKIAERIGELIKPICIAGTIQVDANGNPICTVTNKVTTAGLIKHVPVPFCASSGTAPCWTLSPPDATNNCPVGTQALKVSADPSNPNPDSVQSIIQCSTCTAGVPNVPGCP